MPHRPAHRRLIAGLALLLLASGGCASGGGSKGDGESYYAREALSDLPDSLFVEHDQPPRLSNPHEVQGFLQQIFPSALKRPGARGEVKLFIQIDRNGRASRVVVGRSSGYRAMDRAALRVGRKMEFLPARRDGEPVRVWVTQEITFTTRYH